jgi:hypothetical protein
LLRLRSGSVPACSPLAQVKAAVAHVRRLKSAKGKINPESVGIMNPFSHFNVPCEVSKLAALAQALITLGSVDSPEEAERPEQLA